MNNFFELLKQAISDSTDWKHLKFDEFMYMGHGDGNDGDAWIAFKSIITRNYVYVNMQTGSLSVPVKEGFFQQGEF